MPTPIRMTLNDPECPIQLKVRFPGGSPHVRSAAAKIGNFSLNASSFIGYLEVPGCLYYKLECVAKPSLMAARPSKLSKRRSYTFRHYWTKVHVRRRFSINILLISGKISAIGQYKVAKLRTRIVQFAPYGHI